MKSTLRTLLGAVSIAALAACSSSDGDSDKISKLETDLAAANEALGSARSDLDTANEALSDHRAETAAAMHYYGLDSARRISGFNHEEARADDGSTLTIEFSGPEEHRADIVLDRTEDTPPPAGDAQGERFMGTSTPRTGVSANNVAVLYRIPLGADSFLQYGWWRAQGSNSAGRTWIENYGQLISARPVGGVTGVADISAIQGQATFEGSAAGIYAISNPAAGHNDSGEFTADAMLAVDFDGGTASGTIDNFVAAGEEKAWTVSLLSQEFTPGTRFGSFTSPPRNGRAEVQWALSDEQNTPGDSGANWWTASLIRDGADSETMGAIGGFNAWYTNIGRMTGAFGAKKTQ